MVGPATSALTSFQGHSAVGSSSRMSALSSWPSPHCAMCFHLSIFLLNGMLRIKPQPTQAIEFILEEYRQIMEIELDILMKILAQFLALTKYGIYINYYWQHSSIYNINYITCDQCGLRSNELLMYRNFLLWPLSVKYLYRVFIVHLHTTHTFTKQIEM